MHDEEDTHAEIGTEQVGVAWLIAIVTLAVLLVWSLV